MDTSAVRTQSCIHQCGRHWLALLLLTFVTLGNQSAEAQVQVARLNQNNWQAYAPVGKEADAIYGDYVLQNRYLRAVIAQPIASRNANMTVRSVAGALIDLHDRQHPSDQLSAYYPGKREYALRSWQVVDGDGKVIDLSKQSAFGDNAISIIVSARGTDERPAFVVKYELSSDARYMQITKTYTNNSDKPQSVKLEDDIRVDAAKYAGQPSAVEDMYKSPNGTHKLFAVQDRHWDQAYGFVPAMGWVQSTTSTRVSTFKYVDKAKEGSNTVTLSPGKSHATALRIYVAENLIDVRSNAQADASPETKRNEITLFVTDALKQPVAGTIELTRDDQFLGIIKSNANGMTSAQLAAGQYVADLHVNGIGVLKKHKLTVPAQNALLNVELSDYQPGKLFGVITDDRGKPLPSKIEIIGTNGTPTPRFGPDSGEYGVRNVVYAPHGYFTRSLQAGEYELIISHGSEYDAVFAKIKVAPGKTTKYTADLNRSVSTPGWVSSDFHSHSSPSGDNTGSQFGRVLNLVCEHIEFGPCTEHNRVSSYQPHIDKLGIGEHLATVSGMELTGQPLPLNHQNAFPLIHRPHTQDGGAPLTDVSPEEQIERLVLWDNRSEKLIQQNHPDIGWLFHDKHGDGEHDGGHSRSFQFIDVMEIHPISLASALKPENENSDRNHRVFNWLQLLNQGHRISGVVNTDAHYNYHGSGGLRNWIRSSTDNPAEIDVMELVNASKAGRLVMSNGPFLEVQARGKKPVKGKEPAWSGLGDELHLPDGKLEMHVKVQCPNWIDIDRVLLLINGEPSKTHDFTRAKHPDRFGDKVVKFDHKFDVAVNEDAHLVVIAAGEKSILGPVQGPGWGKQQPTAISNPIYIDLKGDGFEPNKDTLERPLPVKQGTRKK